MKRTTFLPTLALTVAALAACDVTQELQGPSQADGGVVNPPSSDDGGAPNTDGGPSPTTDSGTDAAPQRPVSVCVPKSEIGTTSIAVTGRESAYLHDISDITSGAGRVFVLSEPWTFVGIPLNGSGPAETYNVSATLPNFRAMGIAPTDTSPSGVLSSAALASYNLPSGGGQIVALRGTSSFASQVVGQVMVDQGDVFYFETKAPSRLVRTATKTSPNEILLAEFPTVSNRTITAASLIGNDVYFTSVVMQGTSPSDGQLHRVSKAGGTITDLASISFYGQIEAIHSDGGLLYLTPGGESASVTSWFGVYNIQSNTLSVGHLQGSGQTEADARTSGVAYDGTAFYYGSRGDNCTGKLLRVSKNMAINHTNEQAQVLASNLDRVTRVRSYGGNVYVGTSGNPFYKPVGYSGQLLRWTP